MSMRFRCVGGGRRAYGTSTVPSEAIVATHVSRRGKVAGRHLHDHVQEIAAGAGRARCVAVDEPESLVRGRCPTGARPRGSAVCGTTVALKMRRSAPPSVTRARRRASASSYFAPGRRGYRRSGFGTESFRSPRRRRRRGRRRRRSGSSTAVAGSLPSRPGVTIKTAKTATAAAIARRATPPSVGASWPLRHERTRVRPHCPGLTHYCRTTRNRSCT